MGNEEAKAEKKEKTKRKSDTERFGDLLEKMKHNALNRAFDLANGIWELYKENKLPEDIKTLCKATIADYWERKEHWEGAVKEALKPQRTKK